MTVIEIINKILLDGGHAPDEVLFKEHPQTKKEESAGYKNYTIRIADVSSRANRILLRDQMMKALKSLNPKDAALSGHSITPIEVKENATVIQSDGTSPEYRIFFYKSTKQKPKTEFDESLVCYALSARQKLGASITQKNLVNFDPATVKCLNKNQEVTLQACTENLTDQVVDSCIDRANGLYKSKYKPLAGSIFRRGDKLDDQLGKLFRKTIKKTKDGKFSNMNRNKWNPADIWITKGDDIQTTHFRESDYETIGDLNKKIQQLYDKKHLIGVSLKQSTGVVSYKEIPAATDWPAPISFKGFRDHTPDKFNNIQVYFEVDFGGKALDIQFRTFGGDAFQGSISKMSGESEAAVHGKVAPFDGFFGDMTKAPGDDFVDKKKIKEIRKDFASKGVKSIYACMAIQFLKNLNPRKDVDDLLFSGYNKSDFGSKFLALQLANYINKQSKADKNLFCNRLVGYALSQIPDVSSVHIKND